MIVFILKATVFAILIYVPVWLFNAVGAFLENRFHIFTRINKLQHTAPMKHILLCCLIASPIPLSIMVMLDHFRLYFDSSAGLLPSEWFYIALFADLIVFLACLTLVGVNTKDKQETAEEEKIKQQQTRIGIEVITTPRGFKKVTWWEPDPEIRGYKTKTENPPLQHRALCLAVWEPGELWFHHEYYTDDRLKVMGHNFKVNEFKRFVISNGRMLLGQKHHPTGDYLICAELTDGLLKPMARFRYEYCTKTDTDGLMAAFHEHLVSGLDAAKESVLKDNEETKARQRAEDQRLKETEAVTSGPIPTYPTPNRDRINRAADFQRKKNATDEEQRKRVEQDRLAREARAKKAAEDDVRRKAEDKGWKTFGEEEERKQAPPSGEQSFRNATKLLGLNHDNFTEAEFKVAYQKAAKANHRDAFPNRSEKELKKCDDKMAEINQASETIESWLKSR